MSLLHETLPELLGSLGAAAVLACAAWGARQIGNLRPARSMNRFRRYTLRGTMTADGNPMQFTSTVARVIDDRARLFKLTGVPLYDGTTVQCRRSQKRVSQRCSRRYCAALVSRYSA